MNEENKNVEETNVANETVVETPVEAASTVEVPTEAPVVEAAPVVEEKPAEPVVEEVATPEVVTEAPVVEAKEEPVVEEAKPAEAPVEAAPVAEKTVAETVAEIPVAATAEPKAEEPAPAAPTEEPAKDETPAPAATENKKGGNGGLIIAILLLVGAIAFIILMPYIPFFKDSEKPNTNTNANTNTNTNTNTTPTPKEGITAKDYTAVYKNEKGEAKLYNTTDNTVVININNEDYIYVGYGDVENGKLDASHGDNTILTLSEDKKTLKITSDNEQLKNLVYTRSAEYTKEDYFKDNFGDSKYLETKYNGKYTSDKLTLVMFQSDENEVRISITGDGSSLDLPFDLNSDGTLTREFFDDKYKITFGENVVKFETIAGDKEYDGTYTYAGAISIDLILSTFE